MGKTATDPHLAAWTAERARFREIFPELRRDERYRDRYVAIKQGAVIDADDDEFTLARRLAGKYPGQMIFVGAVRREKPEREMPSPEIDG